MEATWSTLKDPWAILEHDSLQCLHEVLDPTNIKLIGEQPFEVTNWDPAETQRVITAALAKFPQIDGWATDFGAAFASSLPAFDQANREVGPVASEDSNAFGCASLERGFPTMTVSSQNWMSRTAVQWAVALAADGTPPQSTVVDNYVFDDSIDGEVHCDKDLPGDAILSSQLTKEEMSASCSRAYIRLHATVPLPPQRDRGSFPCRTDRNDGRHGCRGARGPEHRPTTARDHGDLERYPGVTALKGVSFSVRPGEITRSSVRMAPANPRS